MSPVDDVLSKLAVKATTIAALAEVKELASQKSIEPQLVSILGKIVEQAAEKPKKDAAKEAAQAVIDNMSPFATSVVTPILIENCTGKSKPFQKEIALKLISHLAQKHPSLVGRELVTLVPIISDLCNDVKKEVAAAARESMAAVCRCTGNRDVEPFIPFVVEAAIDLKKADKCVEKLASCVFVQNVEAPVLALTTPVLQRGLRDRNEELKRTCCVIIDNMCKLVEDPLEVLPLMPRLEPLVKTASESIGDPEARSVAEKAHMTLKKAAGDGNAAALHLETVRKTLDALLLAKGASEPEDVCAYVSELAFCACRDKSFKHDDWANHICNFLGVDVTTEFLKKMQSAIKQDEEEEEEDDEGKNLYKGNFSLAYGTLTLLRDAKMTLKWHKFYGLLGPNNCGKTTLMRAIGKEQLEGFPTRKELLSVFVEHEIEEREVGVQDDGFPIMNVDLSGVDFVVDTCKNIYGMTGPDINAANARKMLEAMGFGKDRAADPDGQVTTYSGGWKMKLQLCIGQFINTDVLMLDEPTGHMDVDNIAWLENWLLGFPGSIICTSHDSKFLNKMCDYIIDFQDRKLKTFKGEKGSCLTKFVEKHPEKKGYFELKNDVSKFTFPVPGPLEGVKSRTKIILKMSDVTFQYPTKSTPTIFDVNLKVSQVSRVAVIGANGAGKSTAIKVLVGEMTPLSGSVWKAPGMRMAYVAQHAFHHLENHLDKTPAGYIMWRFAGNDDRESLEFKSDELSQSEEELRMVQWILDPARGIVRKLESEKEKKCVVIPDAILNRRKNKKEKTTEYEVKWQFKDITDPTWVLREVLIAMGYIKIVQREDEKQAAMAGLQTKHLTAQGVEKHLMDFGVDAETASHTTIRHLSGGQKVKVVIASAMWQNPHLLILDEPTNYLDRDGLGALTIAINEFLGGVLIISHNREFCDGITQEKWIMQKGRLRIEGESLDINTGKEGQGNVVQEDVIDAFGNKVDVKANVILTEKDKKKSLKLLEKKMKDGKKNGLMSENEIWELEDEMNAIKATMEK